MLFLQTAEKFETEVQEGELTVIHFRTFPSMEYVAGWWVNVQPNIFIRPVGTKDKLGLVLAFNIPIAPVMHMFKQKGDHLDFTLFFPSLPKGTTHIDIIESEVTNKNVFNFFNVPVTKILNGILKH